MLATWLPEPSAPDPTYARREEHTLDWLARSTVQRAVECRRFLNENIVALPCEAQSLMQHALRERWNSAFFELIVARMLQELGASVMVEDTSPSGSRPDFTAQFREGKVIVEAASPIINADAGLELKNRMPLLHIIEQQIPDELHVGIWELPNLGHNDSKRAFKLAVARMIAKALELQGETLSNLEVVEELPQGIINLHFWSALQGSPKLVMEPPVTYIDNTEERIKATAQRKRKQVRGADASVLLAIQASGLSSDIEDFDMALFGHTLEQTNLHGQVVARAFKADGLFTKNINSEQPPTYAGVLAFLEVGFARVREPILYMHPRFSGRLPEQVMRLEQRRFDTGAQMIVVEHATISELLTNMRFVRT